MKKLKLITVFILTICLLCACCVFTACGKKLLDSPSGISINDNYRLSWTALRDARSYTIKVTSEDGESKEHSSRRAYYSLANLQEGNYQINIKAISGSNNYNDSEWSQTFEFKKDYESGCIYTLINNNTEYEVTKVGTANGNVILGDTYRNKPVTRIGENAFKGSGRVENVVIGNNVKSIGKNAFYNCTKLAEITIPDTVTEIGESAFHNCSSMETLSLPSGLKRIENYTFINCMSLTTLDLPDVTYIGESAFASCSSLITLTIPDSVKYIGINAFNKCKSATSLSLGKSVETIDEGAFYGCEALTEVNFAENGKLTKLNKEVFCRCTALESISFPEGVSDIGDSCFYGCTKLEDVSLPDSLMHVGANTFNGTKIYTDCVAEGQFIFADGWVVGWLGASNPEIRANLLKLDKNTFNKRVVGIADETFWGSVLLAVDLPETVRVIGKYAFAYSANLSRLYTYENDATQRSDLQLIDEYAFRDCGLLNRVFLNEGLKTINRYAFYNCTSLVNNTTTGVSIIPDTVTLIGAGAFNKTRLYEDASDVVYAGNWVVAYKGSGSTVTLNGYNGLDVRGIADYSFYNNENLRSVSVPTNSARLRYIGRGAFYNCPSLSAVSFSRSLERIEEFTFYKCESLFKVTFTPNLKYIGRYAFSGCTLLDEVDLSETDISYIGERAFYNCINIKKLELGDSIEQIENRAFYKCLMLEDLVIPDSVKTIGERAFYGCTGLKTLTIGTGTETIGTSAFNGCTGLTSLSIPGNVKEIGNYAFYKCSAVTTLNLGEGIEDIGNYAFANLPLITRLYLPQSVERIGKYAFMNGSSLKSVTFNSEKLSLENCSFYGCTDMTVYTDAAELPIGWNSRWNISYRPVVWGCELSDDGAYVVSVTVGEKTISNPKAKNGLSSPEREGYYFVGWATESGATEGEYDTAELTVLEVGTKVYAVWRQLSN